MTSDPGAELRGCGYAAVACPARQHDLSLPAVNSSRYVVKIAKYDLPACNLS